MYAVTRTPLTRPAARVVIAVALALALGWLVGRTPSPHDASVFWVGNLAAPYVVIGFAAGAWATRRALSAGITGAVCAMAAVAGFYDIFGIFTRPRERMGLPPTSSWWSAELQSYHQWFGLLIWGVPPWLTIALIVGLVAGYLGYRSAVLRGRVGAYAVAAVLMLEPLVYLAKVVPVAGLDRYRESPHNVLIWGGEFLLGVVFLIIAARRPAGRAADPDSVRAAVPADELSVQGNGVTN